MTTDCAMPEFYRAKTVTAKSAYKCCECRDPIAIGEKHLVCTGKWDGSIDTYRQHLVCAEACEFIRDTIEGECIAFGDLLEWYHNAGGKKYLTKNETIQPFRNMMAKILWKIR